MTETTTTLPEETGEDVHELTNAVTDYWVATGRDLLFEILSYARPHDSDTERYFAREFLDVIPGMQRDDFGNRYLIIEHPDRPGVKPNVMWSSHIDTVASKGGWQQLAFDDKSGMLGLHKGKAGQSLGADDGAGVWIMLEMIRHGRPGMYVFHRGEERGCLGSGWLKDNRRDLLDGIQAAVAFDRKGTADVITHQSWGRTASDAFARSFGDQLNALVEGFAFVPDDTGVYTDTNEYSQIVPECSNISVGYYGNHGPREELDVFHVERLRNAMISFEIDKLVISRDPSVIDPADRWGGYAGQGAYMGGGWSGRGSSSGSKSGSAHKGCSQGGAAAASSRSSFGTATQEVLSEEEELVMLCRDYPSDVAGVLMDLGLTPRDLCDAIWEREVGGGNASEADWYKDMDIKRDDDPAHAEEPETKRNLSPESREVDPSVYGFETRAEYDEWIAGIRKRYAERLADADAPEGESKIDPDALPPPTHGGTWYKPVRYDGEDGDDAWEGEGGAIALPPPDGQ